MTLLENLHIIVEKTPVEDLQAEIFPMLFSSYESTTLQVQVNMCICSFRFNSRKKESPRCTLVYPQGKKGNSDPFLLVVFFVCVRGGGSSSCYDRSTL